MIRALLCHSNCQTPDQVISEEKTIQFIINFADSDFTFERDQDKTVLYNYPPVEEHDQQKITIAGQSICILEDK